MDYIALFRRTHVMDITAIPELEQGIEAHGIERVLPRTRAHVRIFDNFTMWFSANLVLSTIVLGALATNVFALGFWDSIVAIIIFNVLGTLPVASSRHSVPNSVSAK